ncbi:MAG: gfo/Idh/MocA family oxidoreductase [Firmicutes bacterium HGW-Firmicutes-2]|jgi:predicted dehydrogenase|nr:MAG: gfo/Idh/MocA family oxidoreductase [Firmicutes bacterium HGW-Firmicutes-2]
MVRVAVVGVGGIGNVHINNIALIDIAKVVALCDFSESAKEKAKELCVPLYADIGKMLQNEKIDVVCICTPTFLHANHIEMVLEKGVNVISEKPLVLSKKDAVRLIDLAKQKNARLFVAHVIRFWNEYALLRDIVKDNRYGKPLDGQFLRLSACPKWVKGGWLFDKQKSGLIPFDLHIHDLDFIISLFGKPKNYTFTSTGNKDKNYKEHYRFRYDYEDMTISAEAAWFNADFPFTMSFRVYFERAVVEYDGDKMMAYSLDAEPRQLNEKENIVVETGINVPSTGAYYNELLHFLTCVNEDKDSDLFKEHQIIDVIEILEKINEQIV